ncbi:MAG: S46 family peptidase [Acidobacteria bacterium]|nr:S46 family peptidase [Acidobacteriota bacterium]
MYRLLKCVCGLTLTLAVAALLADEGMWLFNQAPKDQIMHRYGFELTGAFLDQLRLASVKTPGASASIVSPNGLIFTNHHVASGCIQRLSSARHNYMAGGFHAARESDELRCPGMEVTVLLRIQDVTARVNAGVQARPGTPEANEQRRAAMSAVEKECAAAAGNRCDVVTLYSGALYHLYESRKHTDVRLVFAPEFDIAFFGGDPDNFTYPRYCLDVTFLRAYENGRPAQTPRYLQWSRQGARDGETVFVSGHPGSTDRFITLAQVEYLRDTSYPLSIAYWEAAIAALKTYGAHSAENARVARDKVFRAENSLKARTWELKGLREASLLQRKRQREQALRDRIRKDAQLRQSVGSAFEDIAAAYQQWAPRYKEYQSLERGPLYSDLFRIARHVVRLPEEKAKPNGQRLREYNDAALASLEVDLYAQTPITESVEVTVLATWLRFIEQHLGAGHETVNAVLGGRTPEQAAQLYVGATRLKDLAERKRLAASLDAVKSSQDGMVRLARLVDPAARAVRKAYEDGVVAVETAAAPRVARARFALFGAAEYPDATGTLRLSFGAVKGYRNAQGQPVAFATDFTGLYARATGQEPYRLPERWLKLKSTLDLKTPFNFVSTADIIGGNSGSPAVNTRGEIVGVIFDGNLEAMPNRFLYDDAQARAVLVAAQGIVEALRRIYRAEKLLTELGLAGR